ncbi:MAG: DUF1501 domain-containing protein [Bryobacteraceae bacterium]
MPSTFAVEFVEQAIRFFLSNPDGMSTQTRRRSLDALKELNSGHQADIGDPEIASRIASYELAYRMQSSVPELADISQEPAKIQAMYGTEPGKSSFANNCLLARRLVEPVFVWYFPSSGTLTEMAGI